MCPTLLYSILGSLTWVRGVQPGDRWRSIKEIRALLHEAAIENADATLSATQKIKCMQVMEFRKSGILEEVQRMIDKL